MEVEPLLGVVVGGAGEAGRDPAEEEVERRARVEVASGEQDGHHARAVFASGTLGERGEHWRQRGGRKEDAPCDSRGVLAPLASAQALRR